MLVYLNPCGRAGSNTQVPNPTPTPRYFLRDAWGEGRAERGGRAVGALWEEGLSGPEELWELSRVGKGGGGWKGYGSPLGGKAVGAGRAVRAERAEKA